MKKTIVDTPFGKLTLREAHERYKSKVPYKLFAFRVNNFCWDVERAALEPVHTERRKVGGIKKLEPKRIGKAKKYLTQPNDIQIRNDLMGKELKNQFFK